MMGVVTTFSEMPPMRALQRARLCAMAAMVIHAALAPKRPEGMWLHLTPSFKSRMTSSISAWRRWSASSSIVLPGRLVMKAW